jgi:hypothetical protein
MVLPRALPLIVSLAVHHLIKPPALQLLSFLATFLISIIIELVFESVANGISKALVLMSPSRRCGGVSVNMSSHEFHCGNAHPTPREGRTC